MSIVFGFVLEAGFTACVLAALGYGIYLVITGYRTRYILRVLGGVAWTITGALGLLPVYLMWACSIAHECI